MSDPIQVGLLRGRTAHLLRALAIPACLAALLVACSILSTRGLLAVMPVLLLAGIFITLAQLGAARPRVGGGILEIQESSIRVGGSHLLARAEVIDGALVPHASEGCLVRLNTRTGPVDLVVADRETGRAVLAALELDAAHHAASFSLRARHRARFIRNLWMSVGAFAAYVFTTMRFGGLHHPWFVAAMPIASIALALSVGIPLRLVVGTDGLVLRRRFGGDEVISLEGIERAVVVDGQFSMNATPVYVQLRDADGRVVEELFVDARKEGPLRGGISDLLTARASAIAERINEAIEARKAARTFDRAALGRGDRSPRSWVLDLRSLLARAATFREAPPTVEALIALVSDGSAEPIARAAAAAALSSSGHSARDQVRIAAEATATPKLRIALEAAAEDDLDKLTEALAELEKS